MIISDNVFKHKDIKKGELVKVAENGSDDFTYAYFSHISEDGKFNVISNGQSEITQVSNDGLQKHLIDADDFDWGGGYECMFNTTKYDFAELAGGELSLSKKDLCSFSSLNTDNIERGTLIEVKYEESQPWMFAYFDAIWNDGRVQVIPNGRTPHTEIDSFGLQRHQIKSAEHPDCFPHVTFNFWRQISEVTNSGDIRKSDAYKKHWDINLITDQS